MSLNTAVLSFLSEVHYVYCRVILSLISVLLSITSFFRVRKLLIWNACPMLFSCVTLVTVMLFSFLAYILLVVLVFTFQLYFNWDISFESLSLSVSRRPAHNIQQRTQSYPLSPLWVDMVEVLYRQEMLLFQK